MKLHVYPDASGQWRWRLQSANGRIIACSGESFTRKRDARRAANVACEAMHMMACSADMEEPWVETADGYVMRPVKLGKDVL